MKPLIVILLLSISSSVLNAQNEVSTLYFGTTVLDFRFQPPIILSTTAVRQYECGASICDSNGNLLFYSNGGKSPTAPYLGGVFQVNNQLMSNGQIIDSGGCISSYFGGIIVPSPEGITSTNKKYYLFTRGCLESSFTQSPFNSGLTYSVIDMLANNGLGEVVSKYNTLVPYQVIQTHQTAHEPVTVVLDTDGETKIGNQGYWIFSYARDSVYHLHFGINGFDQFQYLVPGAGALIVAPDRKHMAVGNKLYALDPVLGTLNLKDSFQIYCQLAFSPDGSKLYAIEGNTLKQYTVNAPAIQASGIQIATIPQNSTLFLSPGHTVLIYEYNASVISYQIMCPNNLGLSCGFSNTPIPLNGGLAPSCPPNIPAHYLYATTSNCSLGMEETNTTQTIVFPNPTNELIQVENEIVGTPYFLYNGIGTLVVNASLNASRTINLGELQNGCYYLVFQKDEFSTPIKLILNK